MNLFVCRLFFFILIFNPDYLMAAVLEAGTEIYIVDSQPVAGQTNQHSVLGLQLQFDRSNPDAVPTRIPVRFTYDASNPHSKIFESNRADTNLLRHTRSLANAHYFRTERPVQVESAIGEFNRFTRVNPNWEEHYYTGRRDNMTLIDNEKPVTATDINQACPNPPQFKDGRLCNSGAAVDLNSTLLNNIRGAADKYNISPDLLASIIHMESGFDPLAENAKERADCESGDGCPTNGWGKGMAQMGKPNSAPYGLDWNTAVAVPSSCRTNSRSENCMNDLDRSCARFGANDLKPWNCPKANLEAAAKKISQLIPENHHVWVRKRPLPAAGSGDQVQLESVNISEKINGLAPAEKNRALAALYSRGPRYLNSWAEYYEQNGAWPTTFSQLWRTSRLESSPSRVMGYQMLANEFGTRCYVHKITDLCGDHSEASLISQYRSMMGISSEPRPAVVPDGNSGEQGVPPFMRQ